MPWTGEIKLYDYRNVSREDCMEQWWIQVGPSKEQTTQMMKVNMEKATLRPASLSAPVRPPTATAARWHQTDSSALQHWLNSSNFPGNFQTAVLDWDCSGILGNLVLCLFSAHMAIGRLPSLYPIQQILYNICTCMHINVRLHTHAHICAYTCMSTYTCYWFVSLENPA